MPDRLHRLLIPAAALLVVAPILLQGPTCGHDFDFHLLNWLEVWHQLAHGQWPRWAYTPAYGAGEPRFLFYPPLSWLVGALLASVVPFAYVSVAYTWVCLTLAGLAMRRLALPHASSAVAALVAVAYLANPYMLFTAYERTAYGELLGSVFLPLLFAAILAPKLRLAAIALPLALLWLSNAPAAVMGSYALALLAALRLGYGMVARRSPAERGPANTWRMRSLREAATVIAGTLLGLALAAFYILPAAYERRFVSIAMVVVEGMRPVDNFLFGHTSDSAHDAVLHTASVIAVLLLSLSAAVLLVCWRELRRNRGQRSGWIPEDGPVRSIDAMQKSGRLPNDQPVRSAREMRGSGRLPEDRPVRSVGEMRGSGRLPNDQPVRSAREMRGSGWLPEDQPVRSVGEMRGSFAPLRMTNVLVMLSMTTLGIAFLLTPWSLPVWNNLPQLGFLQFPWRLLAVLTPALGLSLAMLLSRLKLTRPVLLLTSATVLAALILPAWPAFRQGCDPQDAPLGRRGAYLAPAGTEPTDEYTPVDADPDALKPGDPPFWLSAGSNAPAPAASSPGSAPDHLNVTAPTPEFLILNRRAYPTWRVRVNGRPVTPLAGERADGLMVLPVPAGEDRIDLTWRQTGDQAAGEGISLLAFLGLAGTSFRQRRASGTLR